MSTSYVRYPETGGDTTLIIDITPVTGGIDNSVLFIDGDGNLSCSGNLLFESNVLSVGVNAQMFTSTNIAVFNQASAAHDLELWQDSTWRARIQASNGYLKLRHGLDTPLIKSDSVQPTTATYGSLVAQNGSGVLFWDNTFIQTVQPIIADLSIKVNTSAAQPAAAVGYRGTLWVIQGGAGVADIVQICVKDAADAYVWKTITLA